MNSIKNVRKLGNAFHRHDWEVPTRQLNPRGTSVTMTFFLIKNVILEVFEQLRTLCGAGDDDKSWYWKTKTKFIASHLRLYVQTQILSNMSWKLWEKLIFHFYHQTKPKYTRISGCSSNYTRKKCPRNFNIWVHVGNLT